jgi:hypothetical protein
MAGILGQDPIYVVEFWEGEDGPLTRSFRGFGAYKRAYDYFQEVKDNQHATELLLTRRDGLTAQWVGRPLVRDEAGNWVED